MEFNKEHRYFELVAGVLTHEQEILAQDNFRFFSPGRIDEIENFQPDLEQVRAAAERLRDRTDLVQWLPQIRALQIEQRDAHRNRLERANSVLNALQAYAISPYGND